MKMSVSRRNKRSVGRRFAKSRRGAAAMEFAIVAPVFLALMFSTFEVGWYYFANSVTDAATTTASRLIRTGQVQGWTGSSTQVFQKFYDQICNVVDSFGACNTHMTVEVQTFSSFEALAADTSTPTCADDTPENIAAIPFTPGDELQIVRVRVCLLYHTVNPTIGMNLAEPGTQLRRIISTTLFRNEPYKKNMYGNGKRRQNMIASVSKLLKRATSCQRGMAATEFALLLPVQVILFFGLLEVSDAMTMNRRVALASNTLADLVAQSEQLKTTEVDSLFLGVEEILEPNNLSGLTVNLVSVEQDGGGNPIVHWSRDLNGGEPYAKGAGYSNLNDPAVLTSNSSIVVVEMTYTYTPRLTNHILSSPIVFNRQTTRWPRLSLKVQLCNSSGTSCTT